MPPKQQQQQQGEEPVRLESLSFQELMQIRDRFNSDIQRLGEGASQLQGVISTISATQKAIIQLKASQQGQQILLPLTSSLYVPGELATTDTVMIDIGTGYYVEMSPEDGSKYCERRIKKMQEQFTMVSQNLREKQNMLMAVQQTLGDKQAAAAAAGGAVPAV